VSNLPGVAIVGAGAIAQQHARALTAAGAPVRAVISRQRRDAERLGRQVGAQLISDRLDALWGHPGVDAVDICTPTDSHAAIAIAAARAGRHVHVEKPMALSLADADAIIAACRTAGVKLMVGQTARYQSVNRALKRAIAAGEIGRPFHVDISWSHGTFWPKGWRGWQIDPARSGGHLVHNGVHAFDLACWLLDDQRPLSVFAQARAVAHPALGTPDYWHAIVRFASGATALCEVGYVLRSDGAAHRQASVYGTTGSAVHSTADDGALYSDRGGQSLGVNGRDAMSIQLADWLESLSDDRAAPVSGADGRLALSIGLAAQRSADTGEPVEVST
jgi:predicted dehydrogenase